MYSQIIDENPYFQENPKLLTSNGFNSLPRRSRLSINKGRDSTTSNH